MDWTLTGALGGVAILAGVIGYGSFALIHSNSDAATRAAAQVALIPAREAPVPVQPSTPPVPAIAASTSTMLTPAAQPATAAPNSFAVADIESPVAARRPQSMVPQPVGGRWNGYPAVDTAAAAAPRIGRYPDPRFQPNQDAQDNAPLLYDQNTPMQRRPADLAPKYSPVMAHADTDSMGEPYIPPPYAPRPQSEYAWRVVTTAKASYFNLGGHVDQNGVVDSLASSYLRDALRKQKNFLRLPAEIKAYIDAPNINLAKIAGYRALLGVDDRKMEAEQGVRFIRVASSRGFEVSDPASDFKGGDAGYNIASLDMNSLDRMYFDISSAEILGFIP